MFANIYKIISARLRERMPELRQIALYNGQYERVEEQLPIFPPACFVEFADLQWTNKGLHTQQAVSADIAFHLVMDFMLQTDDFDLAGFEAQEYDVQVLDLVEKLNRSIQGMQLVDVNQTYSTELTRTRIHQEAIGGGLHIWVITYRCALFDEGTNRDRDLTDFIITDMKVSKS